MPMKHMSQALWKLQQKLKGLQSKLQGNSQKRTAEKTISLPPEERVERVVVEISLWSATKIILLIFGFWLAFSFLGRITSILLMLFFAAFLAIVLNPGVDRLERWKIPRGVGVIILMILVLSVFLGILGGLIPIIGGELVKIWESLIEFASKLSQKDFSTFPSWLQQPIQDIFLGIENYLSRISPAELQNTIASVLKGNIDNIKTVVGKGFSVVFSIFGGVFQAVLVIILTFFLVVGKSNITHFIVRLFPLKYEEYFIQKGAAVQNKITEWVHGQIMLFFIVGIIAYVGLLVLGVNYALTLALIAGLAEFIPYVGPFIAFASAAPVAFNESLTIGIAAMIFYSILQALEGNVIVPLVMKKAVGVSPIITLISMLVGWEFLGVIGMIIAVPVASVASLFVSDYSSRERGGSKRNIRKWKGKKN